MYGECGKSIPSTDVGSLARELEERRRRFMVKGHANEAHAPRRERGIGPPNLPGVRAIAPVRRPSRHSLPPGRRAVSRPLRRPPPGDRTSTLGPLDRSRRHVTTSVLAFGGMPTALDGHDDARPVAGRISATTKILPTATRLVDIGEAFSVF